MVKLRYNDGLIDRIREKEIRNATLSKNKGLVEVRYDENDGTVSFVGSFNYCIVTLIINGTEYNEDMIKEHFAEVEALLDRERMEKFLEEIDDD